MNMALLETFESLPERGFFGKLAAGLQLAAQIVNLVSKMCCVVTRARLACMRVEWGLDRGSRVWTSSAHAATSIVYKQHAPGILLWACHSPLPLLLPPRYCRRQCRRPPPPLLSLPLLLLLLVPGSVVQASPLQPCRGCGDRCGSSTEAGAWGDQSGAAGVSRSGGKGHCQPVKGEWC
jgi:hypothetical protein